MEQFPVWPPDLTTLLYVPALFVAFTVHELAHAVVAFLLGDTSQVERNRLSFNPLRHVSWLGLVVFLLLGFGWAKPVWFDPSRFRIKNRAWGVFFVSIAGITANFLTAAVAFVALATTIGLVVLQTGASLEEVFLYMTIPDTGSGWQMAAVALGWNIVWVNGLLAFWNSLPFPLFDGFQALLSLISLIRGVFQREGEAVPGSPAAQQAGPAGEALRSPAQIHFDIALTYHKEGQLDEAIARYRQAIGHDAGFGLAYYNLGLAYLAKGRNSLAVSSFRAVLNTSREVGVRVQADLRLRELSHAEQDPALGPVPIPPPLEPSTLPDAVQGSVAPLDPEVARRVWIRLAVGGVAMLVLAVAIWLFVTGVALGAMMN